MSKEEYAKVQKHTGNIIGDKCTMIKDLNPLTYKSERTGRGPLDPKTWMEEHKPIMTCYKFVTVHFKWLGLQVSSIFMLLHVVPFLKVLLRTHLDYVTQPCDIRHMAI